MLLQNYCPSWTGLTFCTHDSSNGKNLRKFKPDFNPINYLSILYICILLFMLNKNLYVNPLINMYYSAYLIFSFYFNLLSVTFTIFITVTR